MLYTLVLFVALVLALRYLPALNSKYLNPWALPVSFAIKVGVGLYFLYVYTAIYGKGALSADAGAFMKESAILNDVFYRAPGDYFKLLFGFGDQELLVGKYLSATSHWDSGAQAILSDNRNILRVHSVFQFVSKGDAARHVLFMCFISLIGIKQLFLAIRPYSSLNKYWLFGALLLFPSILFWTSGILKEPLLFLGIGLFVRGVLDRLTPVRKWTFILSGALLILGFKPYVLICAIPGVLFYFLHRILPKFRVAGALLILAAPLVIGLSLMPDTRSKIAHVLSRKQYDFKNVGHGGLHAQSDTCFYFFESDQISELLISGDSVRIDKPMDAQMLAFGSTDPPTPVHLEPTGENWYIFFRNDRSDGFIETTPINDSFAQLMLNIPEALLNSLFRPFPTDPGSWLKYPAMLEVLLLYAFLIFSFFRRKILSEEHKALVISLLIFSLCLSLLIGWVTPVLGAIVRYRIPVFAALLLIGLLIYEPKKRTHD